MGRLLEMAECKGFPSFSLANDVFYTLAFSPSAYDIGVVAVK